MFKFKNQLFTVIGIIPSRLNSSRLPRKPLIDINGEQLIKRVHRLSCQSNILDSVIVATDSEEIKNLINDNNGIAMMTSPEHKNGTERMGEVIKKLKKDYDVYVLINGDEALLNPSHIKDAVETLLINNTDASMLACKFYKRNSPSDFKLVMNKKNELMYISRGDIPSESRNKLSYFLKAYHIMAFKKNTILEYALLEKSSLEKIEDHEHLRLLENGYKISCSLVDSDSISVDTKLDLEYVLNRIRNENK